jgi:hypothetical protein
MPMRIRVQPTRINADPQLCLNAFFLMIRYVADFVLMLLINIVFQNPSYDLALIRLQGKPS